MKPMRRRKPPLSTAPIEAVVEKFSHECRGIARIAGKTTFIQEALPGETVSFQYIRKKREYDEGRLLSVITPSKDRVVPRCPHYALCGGCSLQHLAEATQIHEKQTLLLDLLARVAHSAPETMLAPLASDAWHYRNKARLSVRYVEKKQAVLVGFREKNNPRYVTEITTCPVLNAHMDAQLGPLRELLVSLDDPAGIAQVEVAAGDDALALILRTLTPLSVEDEEKIRAFARLADVRIFLQAAGPDSVTLFYPNDGNEYLTYAIDDIRFRFHPTDFTQVNSGLNRLMVQQALTLLALDPTDVALDLFCGLGNFTLPMAKQAAFVTGIEGSATMVSRASMNARENGITNTAFQTANLDEVEGLSAWKGRGISKLLLDPPRTGALEIVKQMQRIQPERIVYVSCNPATFARDAELLVNTQGYRLAAVGIMDMFPHTAHMESMALFVRK